MSNPPTTPSHAPHSTVAGTFSAGTVSKAPSGIPASTTRSRLQAAILAVRKRRDGYVASIERNTLRAEMEARHIEILQNLLDAEPDPATGGTTQLMAGTPDATPSDPAKTGDDAQPSADPTTSGWTIRLNPEAQVKLARHAGLTVAVIVSWCDGCAVLSSERELIESSVRKLGLGAPSDSAMAAMASMLGSSPNVNDAHWNELFDADYVRQEGQSAEHTRLGARELAKWQVAQAKAAAGTPITPDDHGGFTTPDSPTVSRRADEVVGTTRVTTRDTQ